MATITTKLKPSIGQRGVELSAPAAERRRVRLVRLSAACLLMVLSAVIGWLVFQTRADTVEVWVAGASLDPGAVLSPADLFRETVAADSQLGALSTASDLSGRTIRVGVPEGAAITSQHLFALGDSFAVAGVAQVGLVLRDGQAPEGVQVNDLLKLLLATDNQELRETLEAVPVLGVTSDGGPELLVTVELPVDRADAFALAAARGDVVATIVGRR